MKQPDRFDRLAGKECRSWPMLQFIKLEPLIAKLLRRQHRAHVRLVKQADSFGKVTEGGGGEWVLRQDLLAALARYRKGTR